MNLDQYGCPNQQSAQQFKPFAPHLRKNSPRRAFLSSLAEKEHLNQEANGTDLGYVRRQHFTLVLSDAPNVP
jgi:hypothetical protein